MTFADPLWLVLLILVPLLALWPERSRRGAAARFSALVLAQGSAASPWVRLRWLPGMLRAAAVALLIIALARPQQPNQKTRVYSEGIGIQMLVDCSGSMRIPDFEIDGQPVTRLDAVKDVFRRFVHGDGKLPGRPNDLIGLVTFANFPDVKCPLTLSHEALEHELALVRPSRPSDDGTNIGDAVVWALEDLKAVKAKSKVIILLTDGVNQPVAVQGIPDPIDPVESARVAQGLGVKIYTIGAGTSGGRFRIKDPETGQDMIAQAQPVDEATLAKMAEISGGKYYRAADTEALREIYRDIDRLEKTRTESVAYLDYRERFAPLVLAGLALVCVEQLLTATRLRRIP